MDVIEKIGECVAILNELDEYFASIPNKQSENDQAISDLYHYIENNQVSTKGSYRMVKELKTHLVVRRKLKEDQELLKVFASIKTKIVMKDNRKSLLNDIDKTKEKLSQPYNYRIYENEEMLKERIEH